MIIDLTSVAHGGYAVGRHEGKVVFVEGGIPGERVDAELTREEKRFSYGRVVDVIDASNDRVSHVWPLAAESAVGGADLGHVSITGQRRWKADVITDALQRIGGGDVHRQVLNAAGAIEVQGFSDGTRGTRTRVSFIADAEGRPAMRKAGSHETVPLDGMPLALQEIEALGLFDGDWQFVPGDPLKAVLPSDSAPVVVTPDGVWSAPGVPGDPRASETVLSRAGEYRYELAAGGFWQAHIDAPQVLLDAVVDGAALTGTENVLELYSGAGLFTLPLAERAAHVTAIEGSRGAHADAIENTRGMNVTHRRSGVNPQVVDGQWDVVVLDPPREGARLKVSRAIAATGAERIVYVACDPAALARDLSALIPSYDVESFQAYDLFEHTHHIECVAVLRAHQ